MNAANNLFAESSLNINQMEAVAGNPNVRFVVQWKQSKKMFAGSSFDGVRRYLVKADADLNVVHSQIIEKDLVDSNGNALDFGDAATLRDFIDWGLANYPADRVALIVWNHGNGWKRSPHEEQTRGVSYDDEYGTRIDTDQLDDALGPHTFDLVVWDASLMQMTEVAYELRDKAQFVIGSEESPPTEGYPYDRVFKPFRDTPGAPTATLARSFVSETLAFPPYANRRITQSVLDSSKLGDLANAVSDLGAALVSNRAQMANIVPRVRDNAQAYSPTPLRFYRDLNHVCQLLEADPATTSLVRSASSKVRAAIRAALVWEGHNGLSPNSHGIAIDFSPGLTFQSYRPEYLQLKFAKDTAWDEFLATAPD